MTGNESILLIDNDVMVSLFDIVYVANKTEFRKTLSHLATRYHLIWIPKTVYKEFLRKRRDKKRSKRLRTIFKKHPFISFCPIVVGKHEIILLNGDSEENVGEVDAILQSRKVGMTAYFQYHQASFLTNDRGAARRAIAMDVKVFHYEILRKEMIEQGIQLPD